MEAEMFLQLAEMPQLINSMNPSIPRYVSAALEEFCNYERRVLSLDGLEA